MQARVSGPSPHQLYAPSTPTPPTPTPPTPTPPKGSLNWNLDDWKWDGDLFLATPTLNMDIVPPDGQQLFPLAPPPPPPPRGGGDSSTSCSEEATFSDNNNNNKGKGVCDKRRRVIVLDVEDVVADEAASLTLNLGGGHHPSVTTAAAVSTTRVGGVEPPVPRALCQVQNCGADLTNAKDYHRRHKVCAMHAKASNAMVGNVVQRFCQQCSRYPFLPFPTDHKLGDFFPFHAEVCNFGYPVGNQDFISYKSLTRENEAVGDASLAIIDGEGKRSLMLIFVKMLWLTSGLATTC